MKRPENEKEKAMRIPDPKPMPLTPRARVLREVATFEKMALHVRSRLPPVQLRGQRTARRDMKEDVSLCDTIDLAIARGRELAETLAGPRADIFRPSKDVLTFMDLAFSVKSDFFQHVGLADERFPT
jgi:hypothetical protein